MCLCVSVNRTDTVDSAKLEVALLWSVGYLTYILLAVVIISTSIIFVKFIE